MTSGAVEKQKLVYILNRDAQARLTISSPLEAHKSNTLVYHMIGVDIGFENPTFACLEIDYEVRQWCLYLNSVDLLHIFLCSSIIFELVLKGISWRFLSCNIFWWLKKSDGKKVICLWYIIGSWQWPHWRGSPENTTDADILWTRFGAQSRCPKILWAAGRTRKLSNIRSVSCIYFLLLPLCLFAFLALSTD